MEEADQVQPQTSAQPLPLRSRLSRLVERTLSRLRVLAPWFSLSLGILSALLMERGPRAGGRIAAAAMSVWLLILLQRWLSGIPQPERVWLARLTHAARRSSLMITQSLLQMKLFFALPFFVQASDLSEPAHLVFLALLVTLCAASLWDPLTEHWLSRRHFASLLPATASFVALTAVLPGLGLSTFASMWIAACVGGAGAGVLLIVHAQRGQRLGRVPYAVLVALTLPALLSVGARRLIPAAPLRLEKIEFGNQLRDHWVVQPLKRGGNAPARLFCATAIVSPLGVHDRLFHVWRKDGAVRARIELEVLGGRETGYRTVSRIPVGPTEAGRFQCSVETAGGQLLGGKSIRLAAREGPPGNG
jgi:hypothetical protein